MQVVTQANACRVQNSYYHCFLGRGDQDRVFIIGQQQAGFPVPSSTLHRHTALHMHPRKTHYLYHCVCGGEGVYTCSCMCRCYLQMPEDNLECPSGLHPFEVRSLPGLELGKQWKIALAAFSPGLDGKCIPLHLAFYVDSKY